MGAEKQKTILLVEDDELLAMVEKEILENFGYKVVIANSGEEAVEIVGKTPAIDLVLMDINLGSGIDGTEAAALILRHHDIPVVFLSSHTEPEIVEKTEKITSYGYVVKGSGPTVLQASIKMAFKLFEAKTKEMEKEAKMEAALVALVQQHDALSKLNQFSIELAMLSAEDDLESLITKRSKEIAGAELAVFSEYDPDNRTTTIRNIEMEPGLLEKVVGLLGKQMEKIHSAVSDEMYQEMTKEIIGTRKTLYEMSLGAISRPVGASIQALLKVDRFIGIAYLINGKLYGTSMLAMSKGQLDPPQPVLESFSYLASVSLRRKQAVRQRAAALASLRESELKYRLLVENINDVLYTLDAAGKFTYVSPVIERLSGRKPQEILGRNFADFVHPDDLPALIEKFKQTMAGARESFEFRVLNGEEIRHIRTSSQRFLSDGVVTGITGIMSDISERKQEESQKVVALTALRESEIKYRDLVENLNDVLFSVDVSGKISYISPAITRITGYTPEEITGRNLFDFFSPEDQSRYVEQMQATANKGNTIGEFSITVKDKSLKWISSSSRCVMESGKVIGIRGIMSDISERKRVEELLRASEERYRQLVENTDTGLVVIDEKGIVLSANEPYLRLAGAKRLEDVVGHSVTEWTAANEKENNARAVALCVSRGFIQDFETVYQHADGSRIDIIINATVENAPEGGKHIASLCRNITERKQAELKLAEERKRLDFILGTTQTGIDIMDADFNLTYVDLAWQKVYGDPQGRKCYEYFMGHAKPCPDCGIPKAVETRKIVVSEEFLPREKRFIEVHTIPFQNENGAWLFAEINIDITRRKEAEEEIKRQLAEKEILLREVHHRIKNNIATIGGLISLHLKSVTHPEAVAVLQDAIGRVDSMGILYDKLLLSEDYKDISVKNYIENLADTVIALFPISAKVKLEKHIADFYLDPKQLFPLGIIINELITNKMKYAFIKRNTGLIRIALEKVDNHVTLTIQDNGVGLPQGFDIDKMKGFGLTLVKMLGKQLHGRFSIENSKGTPCKLEFDI